MFLWHIMFELRFLTMHMLVARFCLVSNAYGGAELVAKQEERGAKEAKMIKPHKHCCCVVYSGRKISDEVQVIWLFKLNMVAYFVIEGICVAYVIFTAASDTQSLQNI